MNRFAILLVACFMYMAPVLRAQCNYRLVERAAEQAGTDAVYIRDFKVKLSQGTMDVPSPTGKFAVYLNKGVTYRFSVANAEEFRGKAIVELVRRDQVYASNYDNDSKMYSVIFDFACDRSSTYKLLINYGVGNEGCSAIVMAMVLQDSMVFIEPGIPSKSDSAGVLYLFAGNRLQIAASAGRDATLEVTISQGSIGQKGQFYIAQPEFLGEAIVRVEVKKAGQVVESDSVLYRVVYPPLPIVHLPGESGGILSLGRFSAIGSVKLQHFVDDEKPIYILKGFSIAAVGDRVNKAQSNGENLSPHQVMLINKQQPGSRLIIDDIVFSDPDGKMHTAKQQEVVIVE
ncbi:MAG: hypothetical protein JXB34_05420 [Bacteroidales bacterium]|nr:hypothetical protein [Bacteroidales bacterium]